MLYRDIIQKLIDSKERVDIATVDGVNRSGIITECEISHIILRNISSMSNSTYVILTDKITAIYCYGKAI